MENVVLLHHRLLLPLRCWLAQGSGGPYQVMEKGWKGWQWLDGGGKSASTLINISAAVAESQHRPISSIVSLDNGIGCLRLDMPTLLAHERWRKGLCIIQPYSRMTMGGWGGLAAEKDNEVNTKVEGWLEIKKNIKVRSQRLQTLSELLREKSNLACILLL